MCVERVHTRGVVPAESDGILGAFGIDVLGPCIVRIQPVFHAFQIQVQLVALDIPDVLPQQ